ncbi:MAG: hypothetical protein VKP72_08290 [bacterium]|nr:hypothetical protein [bacterium]
MHSRRLFPALATMLVGLAGPALAADRLPEPPALPEARPTPLPRVVQRDLGRLITRREFVEWVARCIKAYEEFADRNLEDPKDSILVYLDLGGGFRQEAIRLERRYRLFEGVDGFQYGLFEPTDAVERIQAFLLLNKVVSLIEKGMERSDLLEIRAPRVFRDMPDDPLLAEAINLLSARGIITGIDRGVIEARAPLNQGMFERLKANMVAYLDRCKRVPVEEAEDEVKGG